MAGYVKLRPSKGTLRSDGPAQTDKGPSKQHGASSGRQNAILGQKGPCKTKRRPSQADMGMTQSRIIGRLKIKCFSLESWVNLNRKMGKHFESWVNLNQYLGSSLESWVDSESFPLESRLSHELNRFKCSRYCLSHELIRIKALVKCPKKVQRNWVKVQKSQLNWVKAQKRQRN